MLGQNGKTSINFEGDEIALSKNIKSDLHITEGKGGYSFDVFLGDTTPNKNIIVYMENDSTESNHWEKEVVKKILPTAGNIEAQLIVTGYLKTFREIEKFKYNIFENKYTSFISPKTDGTLSINEEYTPDYNNSGIISKNQCYVSNITGINKDKKYKLSFKLFKEDNKGEVIVRIRSNEELSNKELNIRDSTEDRYIEYTINDYQTTENNIKIDIEFNNGAKGKMLNLILEEII